MNEYIGYLVSAFATGSLTWLATVKFTRQQAKADAMKSIQDVYQELIDDLRNTHAKDLEEKDSLRSMINEQGEQIRKLKETISSQSERLASIENTYASKIKSLEDMINKYSSTLMSLEPKTCCVYNCKKRVIIKSECNG